MMDAPRLTRAPPAREAVLICGKIPDGVGSSVSHRPTAASSRALQTATADRYRLRVGYTEYGRLFESVRANFGP